MALNRGLYKSLGTNIVQHGTMSQRWLVNAAGTGVNTTTDEYGRITDPTVGRGLTLTDLGAGVVMSTGRFTVNLQPGNSISNMVMARAAITQFGGAKQYMAVSEQFKSSSVTFQTWHIDTNPAKSDPGGSVAGSVGALAALAGPYCATDGLQTTIGNIPVTVTSALSTVPVSGLTIAVTFGAAVPVNATAVVSGRGYTITTVGTTDFTLLGAPSNTIGTRFVATANGGVGSGTGTCITQQITGATISTSAANVLALLSPYGDAGASTVWTLQLPANLGGTSQGVISNPVAAFATSTVVAPTPVWLSVNLEFTTSTVPA